MTKETAVCFDLDGTLVQYERGFGAILDAVFERELGVATEAMGTAYGEGFFAAFDTLDDRPYHAGMRAALDAAERDFDDSDLDALVAALRGEEFAATMVPPVVHDCLSELAVEDETAVVALTDGVGAWQRAKIDHHDLAQYFDETVVSYDVGGHKTGGEPYAAVRERVAAEEYVMVGDDYEADVAAAREAGFVPIHYEDAEVGLFETFDAMLGSNN